MRKFPLIAVAAVLFACGGNAIAQDIPAPTPSGIDNMVGLVAVAVPDYEGSDDYTGGVGPILRLKFSGERYLQVLGNKAEAPPTNENLRELTHLGSRIAQALISGMRVKVQHISD